MTLKTSYYRSYYQAIKAVMKKSLYAFLGITALSACATPGGNQGVAHINVGLTEWGISVDKSSVAAGKVNFYVVNNGEEEHEFVIIQTDISFDQLPVVHGKVVEDSVGIVIGEIEDMLPNKTYKASFNLAPGSYVLFCNLVEMEDGELESHYLEGMRHLFTVN